MELMIYFGDSYSGIRHDDVSVDNDNGEGGDYDYGNADSNENNIIH